MVSKKESRNNLFNVVIWQTSYCFQDIYDNASTAFTNKVNKMSLKTLQEFCIENKDSWAKMFEAGITSDWDVVAETIACETKFPDGKRVNK